jgi:hypothetical protein
MSFVRKLRKQSRETESRNGRQGRLADQLTRLDFIILDELGYPSVCLD